MSDAHIGDHAELYALGSLDDAERLRVEAHVADCADCMRRLGQAEETVLGLEREAPAESLPVDARPPQFGSRPPARWWLGLVAAAAAFFIGYIIPHSQPPSDVAHVALLHSHFNHAQFDGHGPLAKVIYARDRSWYYVVVEGSHSYSVMGVAANSTSALGTTVPLDGTSELFVRPAQRFERIELRDGSNVIESAQIR